MDEETEDGDSQRNVSLNLEAGTNMWVGRSNVSYHFLENEGEFRRDLASFTSKQKQRGQQDSTDSLLNTSETIKDSQSGCLTGCGSSRDRPRQQVQEDDLSAIEDEIRFTHDDPGRKNITTSELELQQHDDESFDHRSVNFDVQYSERTSDSKSDLSGVGWVQEAPASAKDVSIEEASSPLQRTDHVMKSIHGHQRSVVQKDRSSSPGNVRPEDAVTSTPGCDSSEESDNQSDWEGFDDWGDEQGSDGTHDSDIWGGRQNIIRQQDINVRNIMIGDNNLLIKIGDDVIRHHTVGNIEFELKIRKFQQRSETIDGRRRINISMQIDEFPRAEEAALEALNENQQCDNNLCSRIRQFVSKIAGTLLGFRNGSIILEIKPESDTTVHELFQAVDDGSFDEIIVDILRQEEVLNRITKNKVKVLIDIIVPKQVFQRDTLQVSESDVVRTRPKVIKTSYEYTPSDVSNDEYLRAMQRQEMEYIRKRLMNEQEELRDIMRERLTIEEEGETETKQWQSIVQNVCMLGLFTISSLLMNFLLVIFTSKFLAIMTGELIARVIGMTMWSFMTGAIGSEIDDVIGSEMDGPNIKRGTIGGGLLGAVIGACLTNTQSGSFVRILTWVGTVLVSSALGDTIGGQRLESVFVGAVVGLTAFDVTGGLLKALMIGLTIFSGRFSDNADAASVVRSVIASAAVGSCTGPLGTTVLLAFAVGTKTLDAKVLFLMVPFILAAFFSTNKLVETLEQIGTSLGTIISSGLLGMICYNRYEMNAHDRSSDLLAYGSTFGLVFGSAMFSVDGSTLLATLKDSIVAAVSGGVLADFYIDRSSIKFKTSHRTTLVLSILAGALTACAFGLVSIQVSMSVVNFVLSVTRAVTSFMYMGVELLLQVYVHFGL